MTTIADPRTAVEKPRYRRGRCRWSADLLILAILPFQSLLVQKFFKWVAFSPPCLYVCWRPPSRRHDPNRRFRNLDRSRSSNCSQSLPPEGCVMPGRRRWALPNPLLEDICWWRWKNMNIIFMGSYSTSYGKT